MDAWQVKAHRALRIVSIILTALGGAGLVAVNVNPDLPKESGWTLVGSLISLVFSVLLQVSSEFGIDQRAALARSAAEAFCFIETNLDIVLGDPDPTDLVNKLLAEANALWVKYNLVVPRQSAELDTETRLLAAGLVAKYETQWTLRVVRRLKQQP